FDLILMDIDLGNGIDGTETATQILKQLEVPILFLSSHTEREVVRKTETITSYGYVVKNSGFTVLDASIKMAFKLFDAHENIKNKKEHLETVLHSIGDAVIATDKEGIVVKMNPVAEYLTGWKFDEGQGKKLKDIFRIINAKTRLEVENPVDIVLKTDKIVGLANHTVLISKNNEEFQIADSGSPIKDLNGETKGVVLVFRDVSKEYQIQKHIAEQANMLNHVMDAIIATDASLNITYWNQAAKFMYGWSEEEVIGKNSKEVLKTEFLNISRDEVINRLHNSGIVRTEAKQIRKDNTYIDIEANTILLKDDYGQNLGFLSVNRDITEKNLAGSK
ncbi:MAG: PAS domain S-box protein, partial [Nanoarchaeota archaeon]